MPDHLAEYGTMDLWEATVITNCGFPRPTAHPVPNRLGKKPISQFRFFFEKAREPELVRLKVLYENGASGMREVAERLAKLIELEDLGPEVDPAVEALKIVHSIIMASGRMTRDTYLGLRGASKAHREEGLRDGF